MEFGDKEHYKEHLRWLRERQERQTALRDPVRGVIDDVALVLRQFRQDRLVRQRQIDHLAQRFVKRFADRGYAFDQEAFVLVATGSEDE